MNTQRTGGRPSANLMKEITVESLSEKSTQRKPSGEQSFLWNWGISLVKRFSEATYRFM